MNLKLNYKRTALIGFAFFGITLLWQVYDTWCPTMLTEVLKTSFGVTDELEVQWIVGIIMAVDNVAALLLLPIFGRLSDKTKTPLGKRMPYILTGTVISAFVFPLIPFFFTQNKVVGMVICMGIVLVSMMMYRNPAVSLMPDITPKPLRAKANGIINIMGYIGGAFAAVLGLVWELTSYIDNRSTASPLIAILPFVCASILMVISAVVLLLTVKENKLAVELKKEMDEGEKLAAIEQPVEDDKPLSPANKKMLWSILIAEFLWFMAENAVGTYLGNYVIYYLYGPLKLGIVLTVVGGVGSIVGFAIAGNIADKWGRKVCISIGLGVTVLAYIVFCFVRADKDAISAQKAADAILVANGEKAKRMSLPILLYVVWLFKGFGMALVHNCSFPMVVELATSKTIGKFTGHYYTASMLAQSITPIALGALLMATGIWEALPLYATILIVASFLVFFFCVKNIKTNKVKNVKGLEAIGGDD